MYNEDYEYNKHIEEDMYSMNRWTRQVIQSETLEDYRSARKGLDMAMEHFAKHEANHVWNIRFRYILRHSPDQLFDFLSSSDHHPLDVESKMMLQERIITSGHAIREVVSYFNLTY